MREIDKKLVKRYPDVGIILVVKCMFLEPRYKALIDNHLAEVCEDPNDCFLRDIYDMIPDKKKEALPNRLLFDSLEGTIDTFAGIIRDTEKALNIPSFGPNFNNEIDGYVRREFFRLKDVYNNNFDQLPGKLKQSAGNIITGLDELTKTFRSGCDPKIRKIFFVNFVKLLELLRDIR